MTTVVILSNGIGTSAQDTVINLDAVTQFTVKRSAKTSSHPMQSGEEVSDNYYQEPITISFSGVITPWNFTGKGTDASPEEYVRGINRLIDEGVQFDLFLSEDLQSIRGCVITEFEYKREAKEGLSLLVDISLQQVKTTSAIRVSSIESNFLAKDVAEQAQSSKDKGDETTNTYFGSLVVSGGKVIDVKDSTFETVGLVP